MCEVLVGLEDVDVLGVTDPTEDGSLLVVEVASRADQGWCRECGVKARVKDTTAVVLIDMTCFGRPTRLVWHKQRWCCAQPECPAGSWTVCDPKIALPRARMTDRAARWVTRQVGGGDRSISDIADELGCDWHTIMDTVRRYGEALLEADTSRCDGVDALGLDETLFVRRGEKHTKSWATSVVDVGGDGRDARLVEVIEGRTAKKVSAWLDKQDQTWRDRIRWGTLDMSGPYRKVFNDSLSKATQVADPFHVVKHANSKVDACRRRVQNDTLGHRGRKDDPLYRSRRLLTKAHERLDDKGEEKLLGFLEAGDPKGEVRMTWHAKETLRGFYQIADPDEATDYLDALIADAADESMPEEVRSLAGTLKRWRSQILAWHTAKVTNGPAESMNNLIKKVKRVGHGFRNFANYRIRVLLYAGRPNWALLATVTPR
jgi:transposase